MTLLHDFGLDAGWAAAYAERNAPVESAARIVGEARGVPEVMTQAGVRKAKLAGAMRHAARQAGALKPAVGDWVVIQPSEPTLIVSVLPRRTQIVRKEAGRSQREQVLASNVDEAWIVCGVDEINVRKLERFVAIVANGGVQPRILVNKIDLVTDLEALIAPVRVNFPQVPVCPVQARDAASLTALLETLQPGRTLALVGSSGVGKTTLVNQLLGQEQFLTGATDEDGRGRHTTTGRNIVRLTGGALLMDTPGLREVGIGDAAGGIDVAFSDVAGWTQRCRFSDCRHAQDPGCAVLAAIQRGELDAARFMAWTHLRAESAGQPIAPARHKRRR